MTDADDLRKYGTWTPKRLINRIRELEAEVREACILLSQNDPEGQTPEEWHAYLEGGGRESGGTNLGGSPAGNTAPSRELGDRGQPSASEQKSAAAISWAAERPANPAARREG